MDIKLNYIEKGTGFPFILLHGNGENNEYFIHQVEHFSKSYRVIAIDTRGHGVSLRGNEEFTIRQFAKDLLNFMNENRIDKANILGFSDGGNIALVFALNYPERVEKLILNGANLNTKGVKPIFQFPVVFGYAIVSIFAKISTGAKKNAEMLGLMVNDPNININELKKLNMKTLVIAGEKDMIKTKHTVEIANSINNSELSIIPGDHFIANKNYKVFNKIVEKFLIE